MARSDLRDSMLGAWRTSNRATVFLIEHLPADLWRARVPGEPQRTVRTIAAHLHNASGWIKTLGSEHGIRTPPRVDRRRVTPRQLSAALKRSSASMEALFRLGLSSGTLPPSKGYVWRNLSLDLGHVLTYFVAHEAHHRGQIVMIARQSGQRLPNRVTASLWWWRMKP